MLDVGAFNAAVIARRCPMKAAQLGTLIKVEIPVRLRNNLPGMEIGAEIDRHRAAMFPAYVRGKVCIFASGESQPRNVNRQRQAA